jgi:hypothetical protein
VFWSTLVSWVNGFARLDSLPKDQQNYLSVIILLMFLLILPFIFDTLARNYEGMKLESEIQNTIMTRYVIVYCLALSCLVLSCLVLSCLVLPYLTLPYLTLPYLTLPYLTLPYLTLPYLTLPYLTFPYHLLPSPLPSPSFICPYPFLVPHPPLLLPSSPLSALLHSPHHVTSIPIYSPPSLAINLIIPKFQFIFRRYFYYQLVNIYVNVGLGGLGISDQILLILKDPQVY